MSLTARLGLLLGSAVGLVTAIALPDASEGGADADTVLFIGAAFVFALVPYLVFAAVEREWSRSLTVSALVLVGGLHVAGTAVLVDALDEDALTSLGFFTLPFLLVAPLGVADLAARRARRLR